MALDKKIYFGILAMVLIASFFLIRWEYKINVLEEESETGRVDVLSIQEDIPLEKPEALKELEIITKEKGKEWELEVNKNKIVDVKFIDYEVAGISYTPICINCHLPFNITFNKENIDLGKALNKKFLRVNNARLRESGINVLVDVEKQRAVYSIEKYNCNHTYLDNKTGKETIVKKECERRVVDYENYTGQKWKPLEEVKLESGEHTFDMWGKKIPRIGRNNIDAIPRIYDVEIPLAWWNSSYTYMINVTVTPAISNAGNTQLYFNLTGATHITKTGVSIVDDRTDTELAWVNDTTFNSIGTYLRTNVSSVTAGTSFGLEVYYGLDNPSPNYSCYDVDLDCFRAESTAEIASWGTATGGTYCLNTTNYLEGSHSLDVSATDGKVLHTYSPALTINKSLEAYFFDNGETTAGKAEWLQLYTPSDGIIGNVGVRMATSSTHYTWYDGTSFKPSNIRAKHEWTQFKFYVNESGNNIYINGNYSGTFPNVISTIGKFGPYDCTFTVPAGWDYFHVYTDWGVDNPSYSIGSEETENSAPTTPSIAYPLNHTNLTTYTPQIEISNSTDVDGDDIHYVIEISNDTDFTTISFYSGNVQETANTTKWTAPEMEVGTYYIRALATDLVDNSSYSDYKNFTIISLQPTVPILNLPLNNSNFTEMQELNWSNSTDSDNTSITYYLEIDNNNDFSSIEYTISIVETANTTGITPTGLINGTYYWRVLATDETYNSSWSEVRVFSIDSVEPNIYLDSPLNKTYYFTETVGDIDINYSATDTTGISTVWYSINYTENITLTGNLTKQFSIGNSTIIICANDSLGHETCNITQFNVVVIYVTIFENKETLLEGETSIITMYVNSSESAISNVSAELNWNNTDRDEGLKTKATIDSYKFVNSFTVEQGTGNLTGVLVDYLYSWNISSYLINGSIAGNQTIQEIGIDDCTTHKVMILNFSIKDEETKTPNGLNNISLETDITLTLPSNTSKVWNTSKESDENTTLNTSSPSLTICISENVLNYTNLTLEAITKYSADDHTVEYHYIKNFNQQNDGLQLISLYTLQSADSTSFLVSYKDNVYLPVEDAVIDVWRYYVSEGLYRSVEHGLTNDNGETRLHLVTEDIKYRFYVRKNGVLLYTSPEYLALCQTTPCTINLQAEQEGIVHDDFEKVDNLDYSIALNKDTRTVTLTYSTDDGSSSSMKMNITLSNVYMNDTVCSETESSSAGTLICTVPIAYANTTYKVGVWKDNVFVAYRNFDLQPNPADNFGYTALIMTILMFLTLTLMASSNPVGTIMFALIGLIFATLLQIFAGGSVLGIGSAIIWIIIAGIIIIIKIANRRHS